MILYSKIVLFSWLAIIWCIQQSLSDYIRYNMATPKLKIHSNHCILKKNQKLSSLCINKKLKNLSQDDTKLIKTLKEKYIYSPSSLDYNFTHVNFPYDFHHNKGLHGQHDEAITIEKRLLQVALEFIHTLAYFKKIFIDKILSIISI